MRGKITEFIAYREIYGPLFSFIANKTLTLQLYREQAAQMTLQNISIVNYKNIKSADMELSPRLNCLVGSNGAGKTNATDAVHYMSFCRSAYCQADSQVISHGADFFVVEGRYLTDGGEPVDVYCGMKRGKKKHVKLNGKEYTRLSEHIGRVPLVSVSPYDSLLIDGGSEERRRLTDMVISQYDRPYIASLTRYAKALGQRNAMLRAEAEPEPELMGVLEEMMAADGEAIFARREAFVGKLEPVFQKYYAEISSGCESVGIEYVSHCQRGPLLDTIRRDRAKDRAVGYSLHGIHRDDLVFTIGGHPMKREGSQGQGKTFVVALKLAQFEFLHNAGCKETPLLLLDDIFDKLDASRVERIVSLVAGDGFGQILVTDTNRSHLDRILESSAGDYKMFNVENGEIKEAAHV